MDSNRKRKLSENNEESTSGKVPEKADSDEAEKIDEDSPTDESNVIENNEGDASETETSLMHEHLRQFDVLDEVQCDSGSENGEIGEHDGNGNFRSYFPNFYLEFKFYTIFH